MAAILQTTFTLYFLYANYCTWIEFSLKFVPKGSIDNTSTLVKVMAWGRTGDKPLFDSMMTQFSGHLCVTRPLWVTYENKFHNTIYTYLNIAGEDVIWCGPPTHCWRHYSNIVWISKTLLLFVVWYVHQNWTCVWKKYTPSYHLNQGWLIVNRTLRNKF